MSERIENLAFYRFVPIESPAETRDWLEKISEARDLRGTIIVAEEGLNAMLAGGPHDCAAFESEMRKDPRFSDVWIKRSWSSHMPFGRLDVKVKPEIVTMRAGYRGANDTGTHLAPETFREWLRQGEDMVVVDTRNDFEFQMGTFRGALNPETTAFHEFPEYVEQHADELGDKKVVMFCTGGIRCEKATSWMKRHGIDAFQLEGGVLNYFEKIEDAELDWDGELFVFDQRVGVNTRLEETDARLCTECGRPYSSSVGTLCEHVDSAPTK